MARSEEDPHAESAMVRRELLAKCMTCLICNKLLDDATTISECLHTFCRKCILEKLNDEEHDCCCPVCNLDLGIAPLEKLRPDHALQEIRSKIFPLKRRKVNAPELPSIQLPARRKERSLSSIVVDAPRVATQSYLRRRRTKAAAKRKASSSKGVGPAVEEPTKKNANLAEDSAEDSNSSETPNKITKCRRQKLSTVHPSNKALEKSTENGNGSLKDESLTGKSLDCLLEVVNGTNNMASSYSSITKAEQIDDVLDRKVLFHRSKVRVNLHKSKMQDENDGSSTQSKVMPKAPRRKRDHHPSAQALIDAAGATRERRNIPIWISLVPAMDQNNDASVPQTQSCYLRIKDGNVHASFIQKYLVKKLNLHSESEVEIVCRNEAVSSTLPLNKLADLWLQEESSKRVQVTLGASGQDFVMVLNYKCKTPAP